MKRSLVVLFSLVVVAWACDTATPTSGDGNLIPIEVETIEVRLPFAEFADSLTTYTGFVSPADLFAMVAANQWGGDLNANALVRFGPTEDRIFVFPPGQRVTVPDLDFRPVGGQFLLYLDTAHVTGPEPIEIEIGVVQESWHRATVNWDLVVDTIGDQTSWGEPGGGPSPLVGTAQWFYGDSDSLAIEVDSATAAGWFTREEPYAGARIVVNTPGARVPILGADLVYRVRSSVNPDTIVDQPALTREMGMIHDGWETPPAAGTFRIGGAPTTRAVVHFHLPEQLNGPPELCAALGCPFDLEPGRVTYAGLLLTPSLSVPYGLTPLDTLAIDMRPVLAPERLPRSPLGRRVQPIPTFVPPLLVDGDEAVELTLTNYVRDLLVEPIPGAPEVPPDLALLTPFEPWLLEHGTFYGPEDPNGPVLRLIFSQAPAPPSP